MSASNLKPFPPGVSGNPGGKPKHGMARYIRRNTREGRELVDQALAVLRGRVSAVAQSRSGEYTAVTPTVPQQAEARQWLTERGWGRAPDVASLPPETTATAAPSASTGQVLQLTAPAEDE